MKTFKEFIAEDGAAVAVNNAGGGNIAGIGTTKPGNPSNFAEPPVRKKAANKYKTANIAGEKKVSNQVKFMGKKYAATKETGSGGIMTRLSPFTTSPMV